jgi:uncharacterized protein YecA (UPF0149 family)
MAKRVDRFSQMVLGIFTKIFGQGLRRRETTHRSAPCPGGSGLKFKRCCLPKEAERSRARQNTRLHS